jgi:hypothetical protein
MTGEEDDITRVQSLGVIEVLFAFVPSASSSLNVGHRFRNTAVIRQELARSLEISHRGVIILQTGVMIKSLGPDRFAETGLQS